MDLFVLENVELSEDQFNEVADLVRQLCGINLHDGKKQLVKARLSKRLRTLGFRSFRDYIDYVRKDATGAELTAMLDVLSTNLTQFFRESKHFDYLREELLPELIQKHQGDRRLRVWSAGCSSGEEPYSIAVVARESIPNIDQWDFRILATDLSTVVLGKAAQGIYPSTRVKDIPPMWLSEHFECTQARPDRVYRARENIRKLITFSRLNLMESWPMKGPFNVIFCRNVMIYFDKPTQNRLVQRFWDILAPGGTLFIGHSESLTGVRHGFEYVQPTVYRKPS